jgi:prepilin-type N-terminal cleavage/methylation domain-containing protein
MNTLSKQFLNRRSRLTPVIEHSRPLRATARDGLTLIEMLVATTVTLILMAAIGQVFSTFGRSVSGSRGALDMNARIRTAAWRLRQDLSGATASVTPPLDPADGLGYFEVIEGPLTDATAAAGTPALAADVDDVLLFTTRSTAGPFRGNFVGRGIESDTAEVAWFARETVPATSPPTYTLYRKQLVVAGYLGTGPFAASSANRQSFSALAAPEWRTVYDTYDLSVSRRKSTAGDFLVPNTLADLTKREYRFMHNPQGDTTGLPVARGGRFPYLFAGHAHMSPSTSPTADTLPAGGVLEGLIFDSTSTRFGEDIVLTNVISFDVRVFDPAAPVALSTSGNDVITPERSPPAVAFPSGGSGRIQANGAYVDLGNGVSTAGPAGVTPRFAGFGSPLSLLNGGLTTPCVYDTWSTHYEADGVDQDNVASADQGTNGVDDAVPARVAGTVPAVSADGVIDDTDEWETSPPYRSALRGLEVRIRCYEPTSRQVRQMTVRHTFIPH